MVMHWTVNPAPTARLVRSQYSPPRLRKLMQIWIYFDAGAGGDSLANLIEQCEEIDTLDGVPKRWRIHYYVDNSAKFWAPTLDLNKCFRLERTPFLLKLNQFTDRYLDIVLNNKSTVCTSHDLTLQHLSQSDCLEVIELNQVKVLLENVDPVVSYRAKITKNLRTGSLIPDKKWVDWNIKLDRSGFDYVLDVNQVKTSWEYVNNFCQQLNLTLNKCKYQEWQQALNKTQDKSIKQYRSIIENNVVIGYEELTSNS